jgi:hypothetical protein
MVRQQLLDVDRCVWWRRGRCIATWGLPTTTPTASSSLRDVKCGILGDSSMHHLPRVTYTIRYRNSLVEYDVSYGEGKYNIKD